MVLDCIRSRSLHPYFVYFSTEMNTQLDSMQGQIDDLKDLLSGTQYNFDPTTVLGVNVYNYKFVFILQSYYGNGEPLIYSSTSV